MKPNSLEVHHRDRARVIEVEQKIAVRYGVERVLRDVREPQGIGDHLAVERIGGPGKRRAAERQDVGGIARVAHAREVAREHPEVREHMVAEQHRLRMLEMRVAGQDDVEMVFGELDQHAAQLVQVIHEPIAQVLREQARIGGHLVVARTARVQPRARLADVLREHLLDGHVDVLVVYVEDEIACINRALDIVETRADGLRILLRNDALRGEHRRMRLRPRDVLLVHRLIDRQRSAVFLRELAHAFLEPS